MIYDICLAYVGVGVWHVGERLSPHGYQDVAIQPTGTRVGRAKRASVWRRMWKILIERGNLGFSSAHFITFEGQCEPLHGHNYGVRVEAGGSLRPDSYVLDFVVLKNIVRALCKEWDHLFLLPLRNPHLRITEHESAWEFVYVPQGSQGPQEPQGRDGIQGKTAADDAPQRYVLPKSSVAALPVDNATAERLAELLALRIRDQLRERHLTETLEYLTVGIEETEMQTAFCTLSFRDGVAPDHPPG